MKHAICFSFFVLAITSCSSKRHSFNSKEDLKALKIELQKVLGDQEFTSLGISADNMTGLVNGAQLYYDKGDKKYFLSYDFSLKKLAKPKEFSSIIGKEKPFKIADISLVDVLEKYNVAGGNLNSKNEYEYMALKNIDFQSVKGKLDLEFTIQASKPADRRIYYEINCKLVNDKPECKAK